MSVPIEALIPHRAPMCWINTLTDCTDRTATATACFGAGHFAATEGLVLETALVECVAQTVAAALGHRTQAGGPRGAANNGLLAAVSNFRIQSRPPIGKTLNIEVRELKRLGAMLLVAGTISCEGQMVA